MIPLKTVEELISKHSILEKDLSSGKIDKKIFAEKSKEYADLNEIIQDAKKYISYEKDRSEIQKILDDKNSDSELVKMAETELNDLKLENKNNEKKHKLFILMDGNFFHKYVMILDFQFGLETFTIMMSFSISLIGLLQGLMHGIYY